MGKIANPLDSVFNIDADDIDIDSEYGMSTIDKQMTTAEPQADVKDEDDLKIEARIDEVYDAAITAFNNQTAYTEVIEPRYAARNAEVAANYLNIALAAANSRSKVKVDRKRANQTFVPHANSGKNTTNVVVASREDVLRMITMDSSEKNI